ncbi:MAG: CBS domain-containing protein [Nitrosotalea sp.]
MNSDFMFNLKNKLYKNDTVKEIQEHILFSSSENQKNLRLNECTIEDILPHLLVCSSMATIESKEKVWVATSMLVRFLETFTNNLVVMENDVPVGMLGGSEVIKEFIKNPSYTFFSDLTVQNIMNRNLYIASPTTKVNDLLKKMQQIQRDFALVQNEDGEYSTVSARRLLEVGVLCDTSMKVSDIPLKSIPTFNRDDTIGTIVMQMIKNETEILILENTPQFVNPQTIFEKIVALNYLEGVNNFFDLKSTALNLKNGKIISENTTIPDMCKIMLGMKYSFVITRNNVLTPWDLIMALT